MSTRDLLTLVVVVAAAAGCGSATMATGDDGAVADLSVAPLGDGGIVDLASPPDSSSKPPLPVGSACANPPCLNVINNCPFAIWIHAAANGGPTLTPDNAMLPTGGVRQYDVPASWPAARVNAYWDDPTSAASDPNAFDKVELTVGGGVMNYNITYVDYLALPSQMEAVGAACAKTATFDPKVGCAVPVGNVLAGCPAGLLDGKRCLSAGLYCASGANAGSAYCHALDGAIATCAQQNPATCGIAQQLGNSTVNVYQCSGYFDSQPANCSPASTTCHMDGNKWCAALNRGNLSQPDSTDSTLFYKSAPYNTYAKWVHDTCPNIYAFAYDDYPSGAGASGFRSCTADRLDVTFCPGG